VTDAIQQTEHRIGPDKQRRQAIFALFQAAVVMNELAVAAFHQCTELGALRRSIFRSFSSMSASRRLSTWMISFFSANTPLSILLLRFQLLFQLREVTPKLDRLLHIDTDGCTSQMGEHVHLAEGMEQQLFRSARMGR